MYMHEEESQRPRGIFVRRRKEKSIKIQSVVAQREQEPDCESCIKSRI